MLTSKNTASSSSAQLATRASFERSKLARSGASSVVREIILECATRGLASAKRLRTLQESESLHAARIAIRQLRIYFKAFEDCLPRDWPHELGAEAKLLGAATGPVRNDEVHLAWLKLHKSPPRLRSRLEQKANQDFRSLRSKFCNRLTLFFTQVIKYSGRPWRNNIKKVTFPVCFSKAVAYQSKRLQRSLQCFKTVRDIDALHTIRIRTKSLRYVLQPFKQIDPEIKKAVEKLRQLQDVLGELHDLALLAARLNKEFAPLNKSHYFGSLCKTIGRSEKRLGRKFERNWIKFSKFKDVRAGLKKSCEKFTIESEMSQ